METLLSDSPEVSASCRLPLLRHSHSLITCFTLTLSGIWNDVISLYGSNPLVLLMLSERSSVCPELTPSLTLTNPFPF